MTVIASLVVGSNNATSLAGTSAPLSTAADRQRFLARHRSAGAFIIGKESAQIESYQHSIVPIFVFTRTREQLTFPHPQMQQITVDLHDLNEIVRRIDERIPGDIVVEAGAQLLQALIDVGAIDILEITLSPISGDGHFIERAKVLDPFEIIESEEIEGTLLLKGRYKGDATHS